MRRLRQHLPQKIVIEISFPVMLAMFTVLFVAGWIDGYRRRGDFQVLEAQNARIIQLLEGAEITQTPMVSVPPVREIG